MISFPSGFRIYIRPGVTDMRKAINGLAALVEHMELDSLDGSYFIFCNRSRDRLKVLYWDRNGYCLWHKRLEKHKFPWPMTGGNVHELTSQEVGWLLQGIDFFHVHENLSYPRVS